MENRENLLTGGVYEKDTDIIEWAEQNIKDPNKVEYTPINPEDAKRYIGTSAKTLGEKLRRHQKYGLFESEQIMNRWHRYEHSTLLLFNKFKEAIMDNEERWNKYSQNWPGHSIKT